MRERWRVQYGIAAPFTEAQALAQFHPLNLPWVGRQDDELGNPDGYQIETRLVPRNDTGDGHTVLEEYRGYILDGGGLDGAGANGHPGGHIRLDPSRKEILVEVDREATLNNVPR